MKKNPTPKKSAPAKAPRTQEKPTMARKATTPKTATPTPQKAATRRQSAKRAPAKALDNSPASLEIRAAALELPDGARAAVAHVGQLVPSPLNLKGREPDPELVASIADNGVIEPLIVRPINDGARAHWIALGNENTTGRDFEIVCGERRWKGAQQAGRPLVIVIVRELTDEQVADLQFEENFHRKNLTDLQEADAFLQHMQRFGRDVPEIAARTHKSASYVAKRVKLQHLPASGRAALETGRILFGTAVDIACLPDAPPPAAPEADRLEALRLVMPHEDEEPMLVRDAREAIARRFHLQMARATFDTSDPALVARAGACTKCPKRSGNQLAMFEEGVGAKDVCTDRACWEEKTRAAWEQKREKAEKSGVRVLDACADGEEGAKARAILDRPLQHRLVPLDAPCDLLHEAQVEQAQAALDKAEEAGDEEAIKTAEEALERLDRRDPSEMKTWRDVIGSEAPPVVIGRRPEGAGRTHVQELADEKTALQALKAKGVPLPSFVDERLEELAKPPEAPAPKPKKDPRAEHELEQHRRSVVRKRLTATIRHAGEEAKPDPGFYRALISALVQVEPFDFDDFEALMASRGWTEDTEGGTKTAEIIQGHAARMSQKDLRGLLFEIVCALVPDDALAGFARLMGQDAGAIVAAAEKDAATATPAKKRPERLTRGEPGEKVEPGTCKLCKCTEHKACDMGGLPPVGCSWYDADRTVCTACAVTVRLAAELLADGQRCDHCKGGEPVCEHFARELYERAQEGAAWLGGGFEAHKARMGACLAFALAKLKKNAGEGSAEDGKGGRKKKRAAAAAEHA